MANSFQVIIALLSVLSVAKGGDSDGIKLTNLIQTNSNQTTLPSVKLTWSVHTPLLQRFAYYRVKCSNTAQGQRNIYWKRISHAHQQETVIHGLVQNIMYRCCVELNLDHARSRVSCADIKLLSSTNMTTETTDASPTDATSTGDTQIEFQGSTVYRQEDVVGLYVVIGLLCVFLTVSLLGWLATGLVTYWKITMYRSRKVEPECEISPHNHMHNPLYTSDYVPRNTLIGGSNNNQLTTSHEYDYIRVGEPLERSNRATDQNSSTRHSSRTPRMSIQNESALPLHYETMATYGNRIANRVDTTTSY